MAGVFEKIKTSFRNRAEAEAYLLAQRPVGEAVSASGLRYRIFDRGNSATWHLFEVQEYKPRWGCWLRVSDIFASCTDAEYELKRIVATDCPHIECVTQVFHGYGKLKKLKA